MNSGCQRDQSLLILLTRSSNKSNQPGRLEERPKDKRWKKRTRRLGINQLCQPAQPSFCESTPLLKHLLNFLLVPPLNPRFLGSPTHWAEPYQRRATIPPTMTPPLLPPRNRSLLFKEYVYVSPPYVYFASSVQGAEVGFPVSESNSFREKPEETGPWTESG